MTLNTHTVQSYAHVSFESIVYNRAILYKRHNFLKVVVHVIIIEQ